MNLIFWLLFGLYAWLLSSWIARGTAWGRVGRWLLSLVLAYLGVLATFFLIGFFTS